jgi:hypothetical protein
MRHQAHLGLAGGSRSQVQNGGVVRLYESVNAVEVARIFGERPAAFLAQLVECEGFLTGLDYACEQDPLHV